MTWRTGTKNPHTLYEHDEPVGMVIIPRDGERIAAAMNGVSNEGDVLRDKLAALRAVLERIVKYAREDRARTSGTTRLARALGEAVALLAAQPATVPTCDECGSSRPTHQSHHAGRLCDDVDACSRTVAAECNYVGRCNSSRCPVHGQSDTAATVYCSRCRERVSTSGPYCASCVAAQPAKAPVFVYGGEGMPDVELEPTAPIVMRAAVTAEQAQQDALHALNRRYHRHEAERRVLDAMGEIELGVLEAIRDKHSCAPPIFHRPCLAELARRGLKP